MASTALKRHFPIGKKLVYLSVPFQKRVYHELCKLISFRPDFVITLLRTPNLPPTSAKFIVPLTFNKLDLRDYLFHVYGVTVLRVRSYVEQQKVKSKGKSARRWYRPRAVKKMTVEMDKPFVWPKEPTDFSAYGYSCLSAQDIIMLIASL